MTTHDPQRLVHLLRDHLAAHDKRLLFLFGAGTSSAVNIAPPPAAGEAPEHVPLIPALETMTIRCQEAVEALSTDHANAWGLLEAECTGLGHAAHIESILGRLRLKVDASGPDDETLGLTNEKLRKFEESIRTTIARLSCPSEAQIPPHLPHDSFAQWTRYARRRYPVEVFTTNYDILIERSLERMRVPLFDGFVGSYEPYFSPNAIEDDESMPGYEWARLWKLHGSINWKMTKGSVVRTYGTTEGDMILPSHRKYDESRKMPYLALMDRLSKCMSTSGTLMITCGYSWNDEHVNATLLTALDNQPSSHVIALAYEQLDKLPHLTGLAEKRENLIVLGPRHGVIRGLQGEWALPHEIDNPTASFLDISFDSDAQPETDGVPVTGILRLGDFNVLCRFLASISSPMVAG